MNQSSRMLSFSDLVNVQKDNPALFVEQFDQSIKQISDSNEISRLHYLYAESLYSLSRYEESIIESLESIKTAVVSKDYEILVRHYLLLAKNYYHTGEIAKVKTCFEIAIDFGRQSHKCELLGLVFLDYGSYLTSRKAYDLAIEYLDTAWHTIHVSQNKQLKIDVLLAKGDVYYSKQSYIEAVNLNIEAYELSLKIESQEYQIKILDQLATLYALTTNFDAANVSLQKAMELCNKVPSMRFKILYNAGTLKMRQKKAIEALDLFIQTEISANEYGCKHPRFLCELYSNIAGCYWSISDVMKTKEYLDKALLIAQTLTNPDLAMQTKLNQSHYLINLKDYAQAKEIIDQAVQYYSRAKNTQQLIKATQAQIALNEHQGDYQSALEASNKKDALYQQIINELSSELSKETESKLSVLNRLHDGKGNCQNLYSANTSNRRDCMFIGNSSSSQKVLESALLAAQHPNANVFIFGESGTGKDVLANIIHNHSIRKASPFVPINVAALSAGVLENELFGHVKGAYTGAVTNSKGLLQKSHKGTLFLDEISEMPSDLQSKLLRVVETHRFMPVGSNEEILFDSRIICTSNRDIYQAIKSNAFRLDLFHRLNTIEIYIPPLRDRTEDIEELLLFYANNYTEQNNIKLPRITQGFWDKIVKYSFPGNIRELRNLVERLFILCGNLSWSENDLENLHIGNSSRAQHTVGWDDPEVDRIIRALEEADGKQKEAANILGMSESTLCRRIAQHNLRAYTIKHRNR